MGVLQDEREATYSLWRDESDYRIDWSSDAEDIEHFINCVGFPYSGASALLNGAIIRIFKARVMEDVKIKNRIPGKIIFVKSGLPIVVCGKKLLMIENAKNKLGESILPLRQFRGKFY